MSVPRSAFGATAPAVAAVESAAFPSLLATSPVFYELDGASEAESKCTGSRNTDNDRESAILAGITLHEADAEVGRAAHTSRFVPAQTIQAFLSACANGRNQHQLLDPMAAAYGMPACITLNVDAKSGMFRAGSTNGLPSYVD